MKFVSLVVMVLIMGAGLRYGRVYIMKATGAPPVENPQFSSEESDLMTTVFKSAIRLFTGSATRDQLSSELSDKLYGGRGDKATMSELGIELVKPGTTPSAPEAGGTTANALPGAGRPNSLPGVAAVNPPAGSKPAAKQDASMPGFKLPESPIALSGNEAMLDRVLKQVKANAIELGLIPLVLVGMVVVGKVRRRNSPEDAFILPDVSMQSPAESEPYDMTHAVHTLQSEEFELLVALVYQRQGYRVSMPAGLSGGRGGDFTLARKSERLLVQCKKMTQDHRVPVERVRELHEAMTSGGFTKGLYVASCGFTWDARNFAKAKGVTLINARTLDALLTTAKEKSDEDLLAVAQWAPKLMSKVQMTPPLCPACEAAMDELIVSTGSVWVCTQRPECRGRRSMRKYQKPHPSAARNADKLEDGVSA